MYDRLLKEDSRSIQATILILHKHFCWLKDVLSLQLWMVSWRIRKRPL